MGINLEAISVLSELDRYGIPFEFAGGDEVKVKCPFHNDSSPSCFVNTQKRLYKCQTAGCEASGDIIGLLARVVAKPRAIILVDLEQRYDLTEEKVIDAATVERYHEEIWKSDALRNELYRRGVTDTLIRKYRFGVHDNRITIPVRSNSGLVVNIRSYLPGAPGKDKMRNTRGYGAIRWFPIEQLSYDTIVLCGGECKAIVAANELNPHGIGAITATCGEGNLPVELIKQLAGKRIIVCMDIDDAGKKAADKHARLIRNFAAWVGILLLPLDADKHPKGDINDYVSEGGKLQPLLADVKEYKAPLEITVEEDTSDPIGLSIAEAIAAENVRKRVTVKGVVSGMDTTPYLIPKDIVIACSKDQNYCAVCPIMLKGRQEFTIPKESPAILEFVAASSESQLSTVKAAIGIPKVCRVCDFQSLSEYNIEDTRISPQLEITSKFSDRQPMPAYCIGTGLQLNESYEFTGKVLAHPKTQQATLLISSWRTSQDALSTYEVTNPEELGVFWPKEWSVEAIQEKLDDIYADLEANVTQIYKRRDMHLVADLSYHSLLHVAFDGKVVKGWSDVLIVGDSGQGKSDMLVGATRDGGLRKHYELGKKVDMKNSSVAGIVGGMEKMGERWFVSWGVIPTNDMRLVIMEELKGAPKEVMSKMTDMRSSGVAQIVKIGKNWQTSARTRLIGNSNPASENRCASYPFGVLAIKELIGSPEDIRRFDLAYIASGEEIPSEEIDKAQQDRPKIPHVYTGELCRRLILWAWTRDENEVVFADGSTELILKLSTELCNEYSDAIPLVDRGSMRYKLARLSASLAARLFSCSEDYSTVVVYPAHVEYIAKFIRSIYSKPTFGYREFTEAQKLLTTLVDPDQIKNKILSLPHPKDFCRSILAQEYIELQDLCDWNGYTKEDAAEFLSLLVRKHALVRRSRYYRKAPLFIELLKKISTDAGLSDNPEKLEDRF